MKLLYVMALLIFGANVVYSNCRNTTKKENRYVLYNSTELEIAENFSRIFCNWEVFKCYTECTFFNLTININDLNNNKTLVENKSITDVKKTFVFSMDGKQINCDVTKCDEVEISKQIENSSQSADLKMNKKPLRIKTACPDLFASSTTVKKAYTRAEKIYIDALISLPFNESTKIYDLEEFSLAVVKMNMSSTDLGLVQLSVPKVPNDDLPLDIFIPVEPFVNASDKPPKVGVVQYSSDDQFITDQNTVLKSRVIRVEAANLELKNLSTRLVINFPVNSNEITSKTTLACRFYNVDASQGQEWDDYGSFTNLDNFSRSKIVNCSYDHMTPFAVLLVDLRKIDLEQWKILSYISYIGCSLSLIFSVITILIYKFLKSSDRNNSIRIHVSLSTAYLLLNTSFLFIEWGATPSRESICVLVAVIIEYSLLSSFSWMAIEAIHLYLLLIKVFNTYIKHYMIKLSLFGWGVPAILVGGSLCGYQINPLYGTSKMNLFTTNESTNFCWITDLHFLYGLNITYFSITFLFNLCILTLVTHRIFKMHNMSIKSQKLSHFKDICTVLGLTFLMGLTWGLAFFTLGYINYPILYLFCICNTLQGLFLFLWFYGTMKKNKHLDAQSSMVCVQSRNTMKTTKRSST